VDDDPMVVNIVEKILMSGGFKAVSASSGPQALNLLSAMPEVDLLLTDVAMPVMTGVELAGAVRKLRPELPIVLMSGYSDGRERHAACASALLQKPFSTRQLLTLVQTALGA
jgi:CheY-like chemotaxis protein